MKAVEGWNKTNLDSVISAIQSGSRPKGGVTNDRGDIPSLGGENIINPGGITLGDVKLVSLDFYYKMTKGHLQDGDVLINKDGAQTGKVGFYKSPTNQLACINEHLFILRGIPNRIEQKYLYYTLLSQSGQHQIRSQISGSAQPGLKSGFVKGLMLDLPALLSEQAKIAEILSTLDRSIEQTEALIAKQQRIKTGLMQDLLTRGIDEHGNLRSEKTHQFKDSPLGRIPVEWEATQIIKAASLQRGHDITEGELLGGPYPVVSSSGIIGWHRECTSSGPNVVVGRKGTIGSVHYLQQNFWAHDTSLYVTNFYGNDEKFFYYLFIHLDLARFGTKSGSPSLNRNDIHPIWIGLPVSTEQSQIANILTECDCQINSDSSNLAKIKRLKTALMRDLLTGKKRITELLEKEASIL